MKDATAPYSCAIVVKDMVCRLTWSYRHVHVMTDKTTTARAARVIICGSEDVFQLRRRKFAAL
jgi:hypothetical protein